MADNPGSFRDPGGRVIEHDGRILRAVLPLNANSYEAFRDSGLLSALVTKKSLVNSVELDATEIAELEASGCKFPDSTMYVLEHPRLEFVSYPYEWPFELLQAAALFHLDLQMECLEHGFSLSDATAYNVQFDGVRPIFIDHLSFKRYSEGEIWQGHRQFCSQFLNPLILWSKKGISPNNWYRGTLEGISPEQLSKLLTLKDSLSWTVMTHVKGQAMMQQRAVASKVGNAPRKEHSLSKIAFKGMLEGLRGYIAKLSKPGEATVWDDYESDNSYDARNVAAKRKFVANAVSSTNSKKVIDLGCNAGEYSEVALNAGASHCIGFDFDHGALDAAVNRSKVKGLAMLPLWLDAANPSPSQGWNQAERLGFNQRAKADFVLALAFIHHIAIARNVPLRMVIDWIMGVAPNGIIEFPKKSDPMVKELLANRDDIFDDYSEENFLEIIREIATISETISVNDGHRILVVYQTREC